MGGDYLKDISRQSQVEDVLWLTLKLENGTFLESAVREFSENGFGSEKN